MRARLHAIDHGYRPARSSGRTVADLLTEWMAYRERVTTLGTQQTNWTRIRLYLVPALGTLDVAKLRPRDIEAAYIALHKRVSPNTVRGAHSVLHAALGWAERHEWVPSDPSAKVDPDLTKKRTVTALRALTLDETRAVIAAVADQPDRALWVLALCTGMRFGELAGLTWDAIDGDVLHVEQTVSRVKGKGLVTGKPKTPGSVRPILLPRIAVTALSTLDHDSEYVFHTATGKPISQTWANRRWHAVQTMAGIPRHRQVRLHDLRRTAVTLEQGVGLTRVSQQRLGHAGAMMTLHYTDPGSQQPVADHLDRLLS